jgi:hypothetical protein
VGTGPKDHSVRRSETPREGRAGKEKKYRSSFLQLAPGHSSQRFTFSLLAHIITKPFPHNLYQNKIQADVFRGQLQKDGEAQDVAVKVARPASEAAREYYASFLRREVRGLSRCRHPNVIQLLGICVGDPTCVVMPFATGGNLGDKLRHGLSASQSSAGGASSGGDGTGGASEPSPLPLVEALPLLSGIARGMVAVHAHEIIHLDLKPENILLGEDDSPSITDFGLATSANEASFSNSAGGRGTLQYIMAGVTAGDRPEVSGVEDWRTLTHPSLASLIDDCWAQDHAARPSFLDVSDRLASLSQELSAASVAQETALRESAERRAAAAEEEMVALRTRLAEFEAAKRALEEQIRAERQQQQQPLQDQRDLIEMIRGLQVSLEVQREEQRRDALLLKADLAEVLRSEFDTRGEVTMADVLALLDERDGELRAFVAEVAKKLPRPARIETSSSFLGVRRHVRLVFVCPRTRNELVVKSSEWSLWLKFAISLFKTGHVIVGGDLLAAGEAGVDAIQAAYGAYHQDARDATTFETLLRSPLLLSSEQDRLIAGLRAEGFEEKFGYNAQSGEWEWLEGRSGGGS